MDRRTEINRHLIVGAICALVAVAIWLVFHAVFENLSETAKAVGYVDSGTAMGIALGYVAMGGGTLVFGGIAFWSGVKAFALWKAGRRKTG